MRSCFRIVVMLAATAVAQAAPAADGASSTGEAAAGAWPQWQGRISLGNAPQGPGRLGVPAGRNPLGTASFLGDFYFGRSWLPQGQLGGFRATSGLIVGPRSASLALGPAATHADTGNLAVGRRTLSQAALLPGSDPSSDAAATVRYLGFGYTGLAVHSGWSYSADLGLTGGAARPGRALGTNGQGLDDAIRDLRMAPVAQVGVSYAF